jgi:hypothetical protein
LDFQWCGMWTHRAQRSSSIAETDRIYLVLVGMQNRTFGPYIAAIKRILISETYTRFSVAPKLIVMQCNAAPFGLNRVPEFVQDMEWLVAAIHLPMLLK